MKRRAAVIIGVNHTGKMPLLTAAAESATKFKEWADSQLIENVLLTDAAAPVTVAMVKQAVRNYVGAMNVDQLIVYFSGHGFLKSPVDEYWLLSGAPEDPNEAISLQSSKMLARMCGIPHIVFISDACRSAPNIVDFMPVSGALIFPNFGINTSMANVDMLYATAPGDPAHEAAVGGPQFSTHSIYTRTLLEGLKGNVPSVRESHYSNELVMAKKLSKYVKDKVPREAAKINPLIRQVPDSEIISEKPLFLSKFRKPPKPDKAKVEGKKSTGKNLPNNNEKPINLKAAIKTEQTVVRETSLYTGDENTDLDFIELFEQAAQIDSAALRTGFAILGVKGVANKNKPDTRIYRNEKGVIFIDLEPHGKNNTYFLEVSGGNIYPLAVLPGFVGVLIFKENTLVTINYTPSHFSARYRPFNVLSSAIIRRRAQIAARSKNGTFRLKGDVEQLINAASYFRELKAFDPSLGLYAAYAYLQAGNLDGISSIYSFMSREPEPVLFDVALLTKFTGQNSTDDSFSQAAPFCPLLTQGWSYLTAFEDTGAKEIQEFGKYIIPGLWTAFRPEVKELIDINHYRI